MTPKEECELILDMLLPFVEVLLKKNGEFYPVGAILTIDSEKTFTALETNEYPDPQSMIDELVDIHKEMASNNEIIASGIVWNSTITTEDNKSSDAIIVSLEHKDNYSVIVGLPYKIGLFKKVKFGQLFAQKGNNNIFNS